MSRGGGQRTTVPAPRAALPEGVSPRGNGKRGSVPSMDDPRTPAADAPDAGAGRQALLLLFEISLLCMFVTDG